MAATFEDAFVAEHASTVARFRRMANRAMVQFVVVRLGLVIGSAALPALTTLDARGWSVGAAVFVAILTGLDTQFQWGQEWQHFRSAEIALERIKRDYLRQKEFISHEHDEAKRITDASKNFDAFYQSTGKILDVEAEKFWSFRITKWRSEKAA